MAEKDTTDDDNDRKAPRKDASPAPGGAADAEKPAPPDGRSPWARAVAALEAKFPTAMEKLQALVDGLPLPTTTRERRLFGGLAVAIGLTLALPFFLRPNDRPLLFGRPDTELVIFTPHNETIRREFTTAFRDWYEKKTKKRVHIDWRTPGGTSEIVKVINSEYHAAFEHWYKKNGSQPWKDSFGRVYNDPNASRPAGSTEPLTPEQQARADFLVSDVGIGVDLFFGGGTYDFEKQKKAGTIVAQDASGQYGIAPLKAQQPKLFSDEVIPQKVSGEPYYDPGLTWVGTCLSSFGIVYNQDAVARLGLRAPMAWTDLTDPKYYGQIAVADPQKSGSIVKAFEMIIQQQMKATLEAEKEKIAALPSKMQAEAEKDALRRGWIAGLQVLQRIGANARYFTDAATKVPQDVAQGIAAAGMCIDFYGRTFNERLQDKKGNSRVQFHAPAAGTSVGVDAIAMFRGAPHPDVAHAFLEFILSPEGQSIWNQRAGTPGGPEKMSLRRLPVRKDMYTQRWLQHFADPHEMPYAHVGDFTYVPEWTGPKFDLIRLAVRVMCIDTHDELTETWKLLIEKGFPPGATAEFGQMGLLANDEERITKIIKSSDKLAQVKLARELGAQFRRSYELTRAKAMRGE